jgi:hypothetical protein
MSPIGHFVTLNKLPAAGMTRYDDHLQVWKGILTSKLSNDFIDNIER